MGRFADASDAKFREAAGVYKERIEEAAERHNTEKLKSAELEAKLRKDLLNEIKRSSELSEKVISLERSHEDRANSYRKQMEQESEELANRLRQELSDERDQSKKLSERVASLERQLESAKATEESRLEEERGRSQERGAFIPLTADQHVQVMGVWGVVTRRP